MSLTPKAVAVLVRLAQAHPESVTRSDLLDELWGNRGSDEALSQVVSEIRRKLKDDARRPLVVRTVHKYGYQLAAPPIARRTARHMGFIAAAAAAGLIVAAIALGLAPDTDDVLASEPVHLIPVAATGFDEIYPRVSDDGLYVSFSQYDPRRRRWSMVLRHRHSGDSMAIDDPDASLVSPVYHAGSDRLAYLRYRDGECTVMVSSRSGNQIRPLSDCLDEGLPALIDLSADATRIAYTATTGFPRLGRGISIVSVESAETTVVSSPEGAHITDHTPRFGPDGSLGFLRQDFRSGRTTLHVVSKDGDERILAPEAYALTGFSWAPPSGDILILLSDNYLTRIAELDADLEIRRFIATIPHARHLEVTESEFLFATRSSIDSDIARVSIDEAGTPSMTTLTQWSTRERLPRLSPDHRQLAFVSDQSGSAQVWLKEPLRQLTSLVPAYIHSIDWIDDATLVLGYVTDHQQNQMALVALDTGKATQLTQCSDPLSVRADRHTRRILAVVGSADHSGAVCAVEVDSLEATHEDNNPTMSLAIDDAGYRYQALFNSGLRRIEGDTEVRLPIDFDPVLAHSWDVRQGVLGVAQQISHQRPEGLLRLIQLATGDQRSVLLESLDTSGGIEIIDHATALVTIESGGDWDVFSINRVARR